MNELIHNSELGRFFWCFETSIKIDQTLWTMLRALNSVDVGGELVIRLLNDKRSLFRQLLEGHVSIFSIN